MKSDAKTKRIFEEKLFSKYIKNNIGILIGLILICIVLWLTTEYFLTTSNILVVFRQVSINAMIAFGMTYVILIGGIDLSVGAIIAFSGIFTTVALSRWNVGLPLSISIGLISGAVAGLSNGLIVAKLKLPPFIVTLATGYIAKGFAYIVSDGKPVSVDNEAFYQVGNGYLGPIPYPVVYMLIIFVILSYILYKTRFGRRVYAIGGNIEAAKYSGIRTERIQIACYTMTGVLAAIGGIVTSARLFSGQPTIGVNAELDAIAAVILGGASLAGGMGTLGGSLIGALLMGVINNGLNLLGVNSFWQWVAKGLIILLAVYGDVLRKKRVSNKI